jgi:putative ATPase
VSTVTYPPRAGQPEELIGRVGPEDLIGPAARVWALLSKRVARQRASKEGRLKVLLYGPPGTGKTTVARLAAEALVGGATEAVTNVEVYNGRTMTPERVKHWLATARIASFYSEWIVYLVDEVDTCPRDVQDLLLTFLDDLPPSRAFIATSNLDLDNLTERFATRLQQFEVGTPAVDEVRAALVAGWGSVLPAETIAAVAAGSQGNMRAALLDLQSCLDAAEVGL